MGIIIPGQHLSAATEFKNGNRVRLGKPGAYHGGSKPGHFISEETKKKISAANKGRITGRRSPGTEIRKGQHLSPSTEFKKGDRIQLGNHNKKPGVAAHYAKKRHLTYCLTCGKELFIIESKWQMWHRHFCSIRCRQAFHVGEFNNKWRGGVTPKNSQIRHSDEYKQWRLFVFVRDGFMCQLCHGVGGKLHAHHIKSFSEHPELRFSVDNGITLCKLCHIDIHSHVFG